MPKWLIFDAFTLLICEKNVANHALLRCKIFKLKIWLCKIFDKYNTSTELLETMELMELIEPKQLMELTEFMELLESWLLLWIGGYDWIDRADGASGISGMKGGNSS